MHASEHYGVRGAERRERCDGQRTPAVPEPKTSRKGMLDRLRRYEQGEAHGNQFLRSSCGELSGNGRPLIRSNQQAPSQTEFRGPQEGVMVWEWPAVGYFPAWNRGSLGVGNKEGSCSGLGFWRLVSITPAKMTLQTRATDYNTRALQTSQKDTVELRVVCYPNSGCLLISTFSGASHLQTC